MTNNAMKTEANRRDNSRGFLPLKAYGYNLVLKDHKHCLQIKRALFSRLKEGKQDQTRSGTRKQKNTSKKSMFFTEQGQQLSLGSFTRLGGRRREVIRRTGEEIFNVYAWRGEKGRGGGIAGLKDGAMSEGGKKEHVITSSGTTEVYAVETWNTILASLFFFFLQYQYTCCFKYLLQWHTAINTSNIQYMPVSATERLQTRRNTERKKKRIMIKVGWTERTEQEQVWERKKIRWRTTEVEKDRCNKERKDEEEESRAVTG